MSGSNGWKPPHDLEAEEALLGCMLVPGLGDRAVDAAMARLSPDDFYRPNHRAVCSAIYALAGHEHGVDTVTVSDELRRQKQPHTMDLAGLVSLMSNGGTSAAAERYIEIIANHSLSRRLIASASEAREAASRGDNDEATRLMAVWAPPSANGASDSAGEWPWLDPSAFHGLAGRVVRLLEPHTESDPAALLLTFLVAFGCAVGPGPHAVADSAQHSGRLFAVLVGESAKARKGSSWVNVRRVLSAADPVFTGCRVLGGFGSGEVVVDQVRDPKDGGTSGDRRVLVLEPEFARILKVAGREGATLSQIIRQAWDGDRLEARSRLTTSVATGAHIALLGHVTKEELRARLAQTEIAAGFANRMLFVCVRQSKLLPAGGNLDDMDVAELATDVKAALERAKTIGRLHRTAEAEARWAELYAEMAEDDPGGLLGAVIARDAPQCLRLSVAYALLDGSHLIDIQHVEAAWAVWRYCRSSAAYIFGEVVGSEIADRLLAALRQAGPKGLTLQQQSELFGRNVAAEQLMAARGQLARLGLVVTEKGVGDGPGRPPTVTRIRTKETKETKEFAEVSLRPELSSAATGRSAWGNGAGPRLS